MFLDLAFLPLSVHRPQRLEKLLNPERLESTITILPGWCKRDVPESDVSGLTTLQIDRSW